METKLNYSGLKEYITEFFAFPFTIFSNISDENQAMIAYRGDLYFFASECCKCVCVAGSSNNSKLKWKQAETSFERLVQYKSE